MSGAFYHTPLDLLTHAGNAFKRHITLAATAIRVDNPQAQPSHLCLRSANEADYQNFRKLAAQLGKLVEYNRPDGRHVTWLELNQPLIFKSFNIKYLEFTEPSAHETGPQSLVFAEPRMVGPDVLINSCYEPGFVYRCQPRAAWAIIAAAGPR